MLRLELDVAAEWPRIAVIRDAVAHCVTAVFQDATLRDDIAMTVSELLENAVKYGRGPNVSLAMTNEAGAIVVRVANTVDEGSSKIDVLEQRLRWIGTFADPAEAYAAAIVEVAKAPGKDHTESGLGLVRIVSEGACTLECISSESGTVVMCARRPIGPSSSGTGVNDGTLQ